MINVKSIFMAFSCLVIISVGSVCYAENENAIYKIYPTQNYWTSIELDTSTGKMWQVHAAINDNKARGKLVLNAIPLTEEPQRNRFELYPTGNMYNFVLLDTVNGRTWQVQWSFNALDRGIIAAIN